MNDQGVAGLVVAFLLAQLGIWLDQRRRHRKTDATLHVVGGQAHLAAERSEPTANGFAEDVREGLASISEGQSEIKQEVMKLRDRVDQHLMDHASADVRRSKDR